MTPSTITSATTGTFTATIDGSDFIAARVNIYSDADDIHHFSGSMGSELPNDDFQSIYITTKKDVENGSHTYPKGIDTLVCITKKGQITDKAKISVGTCTVDFDKATQHFKMSFDVKADYPPNLRLHIKGSFDLTSS
jgi:hypothetical protein